MERRRSTTALCLLTVVLAATAGGCGDGATAPAGGGLSLVANRPLAVPEPSGLTVAPGGGFATVSDDDGRLYRLDAAGGIVATLAYRGSDPEGVAWDAGRDRWLVVEEGRRDVVELDPAGHEAARHHLDLPGNDPGSGLEGVAVRPGDGAVFVLLEKNPARIYRLGADWRVAASYEPDAGEDLSGICWDPGRGHFWIVSDQARVVFAWTPDRGATAVYDLPLSKAEGVAVDADGRLCVVSDREERLYVFEIAG